MGRQPAKLLARGSIPPFNFGLVAQLVERLTLNQNVVGSIPTEITDTKVSFIPG